MWEHASAMIGRKLTKKLKVFRMTDVHIVYTTSFLKILYVSIVPDISYFNFFSLFDPINFFFYRWFGFFLPAFIFHCNSYNIWRFWRNFHQFY